MSTLVLNGLNGINTTYNSIVEKLISGMEGMSGLEVIDLKDKEVAPCRGCFACWLNTPGVCIIDDAGREVAKNVINSELLILLTPVIFGGVSSTLKKGIDRLIPNILPHFRKINGEIHHKARYKKYPELMAVGLLEKRDDEVEEIFSHLFARMAINLYSPVHKTFFLYANDSTEDLDKAVNRICLEVGGRSE